MRLEHVWPPGCYLDADALFNTKASFDDNYGPSDGTQACSRLSALSRCSRWTSRVNPEAWLVAKRSRLATPQSRSPMIADLKGEEVPE